MFITIKYNVHVMTSYFHSVHCNFLKKLIHTNKNTLTIKYVVTSMLFLKYFMIIEINDA